MAGCAAGGLLDARGRAILAMLADTMIPEAVVSTHDYTGLITGAGILTALAVVSLTG